MKGILQVRGRFLGGGSHEVHNIHVGRARRSRELFFFSWLLETPRRPAGALEEELRCGLCVPPRLSVELQVQERAENLRLRDEVKELKERLKVLERITVEKENSLSREIDDLRDR